jgi:hypothetical protein
MNTRSFVFLVIGGLVLASAASAHQRSSKVQGEINAFSSYVDSHPEMVIDFSEQSGEYCMNTWKVGGGHMTHYSTDPSKSSEDVIDFVRVESFSGAVDVDKLPRLPSELGKMEPNKWYYLPAGAYDPHHNTEFEIPLLVRSANVQ